MCGARPLVGYERINKPRETETEYEKGQRAEERNIRTSEEKKWKDSASLKAFGPRSLLNDSENLEDECALTRPEKGWA